MKIKRFLILTFLLLLLAAPNQVSYARKVSVVGQLFKELNHGVVTVFSSISHGSGFLVKKVDNYGLILTNSHVVNGMKDNIRIRFHQDEVVKGVLLVEDKEKDLALVVVNMENIPQYKVLEFFTPPLGEDLVLVGEEVFIIGSPINRISLDKTLASGIVGKFSNDIIRHDISLNPGNSGGPLINYEGKVVGVNTFVEASSEGTGINSSVAINLAEPVLSEGEESIQTLSNLPSAKLLPDISPKLYNSSEFYKKEQEAAKKRNARYATRKKRGFDKVYKLRAKGSFQVIMLTPLETYRLLVQEKEEKNKKLKKNLPSEGNLGITDNSNSEFYNHEKPVVTVYVVPTPTKTGSSGGKRLLRGASVLGSVALGVDLTKGSAVSGKLRYANDFKSLSLKDSSGNVVCEPVATGIKAFSAEKVSTSGMFRNVLDDSSYMGIYEYNPECFQQSSDLFVEIENTKGKAFSTSVKQSTLNKINDDFALYFQ